MTRIKLNRTAEIHKLAAQQGITPDMLEQKVEITRKELFASSVDSYYRGFSEGQDNAVQALAIKPRIMSRGIVVATVVAIVLINLPLLVLYALHVFRTY